MSEGRFFGQNVFVTGGGSGIGFACARAFALEGANVLIMGRNMDKLSTAAHELRGLRKDVRIETYAGDVGTESHVKEAVGAAVQDGCLDIAVASAGAGGVAPIMATEGPRWDHIIRTNLTGTFYTIKHAATMMARSGGGAICAISSIAGVRTHRFMGTYCASKAGVDMLVKNSADELGVANIRVNSVCPGLVNTSIAVNLMANEDIRQDYLDCMPIRRTGVVEDISSAVQFLCSSDASWITGVNLSVDGGHHLRRGPNVDSFARVLFGDDIPEGKI